jgi:hypothetical protein
MCLYMTIYDEWCRFSLVNSKPILTLVIQVSTFHKYFILVSCSRTPTSKQVEIAPFSDTRIFSSSFYILVDWKEVNTNLSCTMCRFQAFRCVLRSQYSYEDLVFAKKAKLGSSFTAKPWQITR